MGIFNFRKKEDPKLIGEEIKAFEKKGIYSASLKDILSRKGEGWETIAEIPGYGVRGVSTFNMFYNNFINRAYETELQRIKEYRDMAAAGEVADVIEDAVNESTQDDDEGNILNLIIKDKELAENENIVKNIQMEFNELFRERISIKEKIWDLLWYFYVDGRVYYERVIDSKSPKKGIINIKRLPSETMDFFYDPMSGRVIGYVQYTRPKTIRPLTVEDARKRDGVDLIYFDPNQIGFIDNGIYGKSRYEILGYLEKSKVPFNQLKMLETAVIIMRIVRAPERLVFRIDTGNMPRDKALKYVEKVKTKMSKKQTYDPKSGKLTHEPEILCIRKDTQIPLLDSRVLTLEQIIEEYNSGKENWVYTINQTTHNVEPGKITNAKITRKNEKIIRVWLDSGNYIDTTYDHKFILRDGSERMASELSPGTSLMPLYRKKEIIHSKAPNNYDHVNKQLLIKMIQSIGFKDYPDFKANYKTINHKVSRIEYLEEQDDTGCITVEGNHNFAVLGKLSDTNNSIDNSLIFLKNSILENFYLPQSSEGRGSSVETIGGNTAQFSELADVFYFQDKLYRSLKYPMSRVHAGQDRRDAEINQHGGGTEISRDEIKWAKFLERNQQKICKDFVDMFLLHLEFKGLKEMYGLSHRKIGISMNPPSHYKEQMEQVFNDARFANYSQLADRPEMSKYYVIKRYLHWDDEEIKANVEGKKKDVELGLAEKEDSGGGGGGFGGGKY